MVTREGEVLQDGSTSSYLANFVFCGIESALNERIKAKVLKCFRLADEITVSSKAAMPQEVATQVIGSVT